MILGAHAPHKDSDDREDHGKHQVHVQAGIYDPVAQRTRSQRSAAHPEAQPRERIDAAQASRTRLGSALSSRVLLDGLIDEVAPLVNSALRVDANGAGVAAHDGAQDGQPGAPADDSRGHRDERADRGGHPRAFEERGDDTEGRADGRPQSDVHPGVEDLG